MKKEDKKRNIGIVLGLIILLIMVIGVTYAAFQYTKSGTKENTLTTGTISFKYNETSNGVTLSNATPMQDSEGKKLQKGEGEGDNGYFDFNVDSHLGADTEVQYYVYAVDTTGDIENKLDPKYVKVYLTDQSSPENPYEGYDDEEVPVYSELDNVTAQTSDKQQITGKLLYQNKFTESGTHFYRLRIWVSNDYEDSKVARTFKMRVDVNTDAEITSSDTDKPTCTIENAQPKKASRDEDITMTIKCTDNNGTVTSNMTSENIHVKQNGSEVQPTKKELGEGIATAAVTGKNGVQHTLTLNGFNQEGDISISIDKGVITDKKGNTNDEINLDTGVSISKRVTVTLSNGGGVQSFGEQDKLTCDIKEGDTCNVTLPTITKQDGYTGSFWSEQETAKEGKQPGSIEVSSDTTYYAIGYKDIELTYEKDGGVEALSEESGSCIITGKESTCEVTLPTITGKTGYKDKIYWGENNNTEYESRIQEEKVEVSDNKTYYAFAKDETPPVCSLYEATPSNPTTEETITVKIDCTDTSGSLKTDLTTDNVETKVAEAVVSPTKSLTDITTITNGKRYTITLSGFTTTGALTLTVVANAVTDSSNNGNISTTITPSVTIKSACTAASTSTVLGLKYNSSTSLNYEPGCDSIHNMYKFTQPDGSTGYRYIGNTEKNYVNLLGTDDGKTDANLWRIIGVFEEENASGVKAKRIKLILNERLNNTNYSWDNNGSLGSNNWTRPAALNTILNGAFWNASSGSCPRGGNNATTSCSFTSYKMNTVQDKIETMRWHLGATTWNQQNSTEHHFTAERGSTAAGGGGATTYDANVGLMYPSDYGYTYAKGVSDTCFNTIDNNSGTYCNSTEGAKSWMWKSAYAQWTISPISSNASQVFGVLRSEYMSNPFAYSTNEGVRPVVYLKSNIGITGGEGTKTDPYTVG